MPYVPFRQVLNTEQLRIDYWLPMVRYPTKRTGAKSPRADQCAEIVPRYQQKLNASIDGSLFALVRLTRVL